MSAADARITAQVRLARGSADIDAALDVRVAVFCQEQGVPIELEHDGHDAEADHVLAQVDGSVVATGRLLVAGAVGMIGRIAVLPAYRARGLGTAVVETLEARAHARGVSSLELHAQIHVEGFYRQLGYTAYGEPFDEAGIAHVAMRKTLIDEQSEH